MPAAPTEPAAGTAAAGDGADAGDGAGAGVDAQLGGDAARGAIDAFLAQTFAHPSGSLLPLLLEWLLVEEELLATQAFLEAAMTGAGGAAGGDLPAGGGWEKKTDEASGAPYYVHVESAESRWDEPPPVALVSPALRSAVYALRAVYLQHH